MRPIAGTTALALSALATIAGAVTEAYSGQYPDDCPSLCKEAGPAASNWTRIHHLRDLASCHHDVLFDLNVHNSVDDPDTILTIRACVSTGDETYDTRSEYLGKDSSAAAAQSLVISEECGAKSVKSFFMPHVGSGASLSAESVASTTTKLKSFMECAVRYLYPVCRIG